MSPMMAAAVAITGRITDVREMMPRNSKSLLKSSRLEISCELDEDEMNEASDHEEILDQTMDILPTTETKKSLTSTGSSVEKFTRLKGAAAAFVQANVDTNAIIPKQFLKTIKRTGLAGALFNSLRFDGDVREISDFVLNRAPYRKASILVSGENFGCGSSREHAVWAFLDFGIRAIIAPSFADIFFNNCFKNGVLPVVISDEKALHQIVREAEAGHEVEVDLVRQVVSDAAGNIISGFEVEEQRKYNLLEGLDEISISLQMDAEITKFEAKCKIETPWLMGRTPPKASLDETRIRALQTISAPESD